MFPRFLPPEVANLTELTSIDLATKIKQTSVTTPLTKKTISTTYVQEGNKQSPILLLHGFDSSVLEFRRLLPLLGSKWETWAVDLWGFGFTERVRNLSFSKEAIKTHLHYFWKQEICQPVTLLGASMGGAAALDFAITYPEAVRTLVLLDSAGLANPPLLGKLMFPPLDRWATDFLRNPKVRQGISHSAYYNKSLASQDAYLCAALHLTSANWSEALIAFTKSGGYGSFLSQLKQIKQPTLIIWGENDRILGTKAAYKFQQAIVNSELKWIKECGHVPHLEQPQITSQIIEKWLSSLR